MIKVALDSFALMLLFALMTTYIVTNARIVAVRARHLLATSAIACAV